MNQGQQQWLKRDRRVATWIVAAVPFVEITALGADGPALGAVAATLNCFAGTLLLAIAKPPAAFFRSIALPMMFVIGGLLWATWPDLTRAFSLPAFIGSNDARIAADLVAADAARGLGSMALLVGAAATSYRRGLLRVSIDALCVAAVLNLVLGLALRQYDPAVVWGFDKGLLARRFTGTMLNANAMGTIYGASAVLALGGALSAVSGGMVAKRSLDRSLVAYLLGVALLLAATGLTASRTAFIVTIGGGVLLVAVSIIGSRDGPTRRGKALLAGLGIAMLAVAGGGIAAIQRLPKIETDAVGRVALWDHFLTIAAGASSHGYGLGSFAAVNEAFLPRSDLATGLWYVNSAHNVLIQMTIEGGWPYAALVTLGIALIAFRILRHLPTAGSARILTVAVAVALSVFLAVGMIDVALNIPGSIALATVLLGLGWGYSLRHARNSEPLFAGADTSGGPDSVDVASI